MPITVPDSLQELSKNSILYTLLTSHKHKEKKNLFLIGNAWLRKMIIFIFCEQRFRSIYR